MACRCKITVFCKHALCVACILSIFTGCHPKAYRFGTAGSDRVCSVTVHEMSAGGNCETRGKEIATFALWSKITPHYTSIAQGISSSNKDMTITRGLIINGSETGPRDEHWHELLRDPKLLCIEACGREDWTILK